MLATQNPYEFEGTYVLPESQLDRFMIRLRMGYPIRSEERKVLASHRDGEPVETLGRRSRAEDVSCSSSGACEQFGWMTQSPTICSTSCMRRGGARICTSA